MAQARQRMRKETDDLKMKGDACRKKTDDLEMEKTQQKRALRQRLGAGVADKAEFEAAGVEIGDEAEWGVRFVHGPT